MLSKVLRYRVEGLGPFGRGRGRLTYTHGLVDGWARVPVGVFIVGEAARLARERGSARPGSSHCCST
jgi:hypothetical protein